MLLSLTIVVERIYLLYFPDRMPANLPRWVNDDKRGTRRRGCSAPPDSPAKVDRSEQLPFPTWFDELHGSGVVAMSHA
jgi:hypothetical protein